MCQKRHSDIRGTPTPCTVRRNTAMRILHRLTDLVFFTVVYILLTNFTLEESMKVFRLYNSVKVKVTVHFESS